MNRDSAADALPVRIRNKNSAFLDSSEAGEIQKTLEYPRIMQSVPDNARSLSIAGYLLAQAGQMQASMQAYRQTLRIQEDSPRHWVNYAISLERLGYYEGAMESYTRALALSPSYFKAMYGKSKNLYRLTHYQAALESYEAALAVRDDAYEVWYGRRSEERRVGKECLL